MAIQDSLRAFLAAKADVETKGSAVTTADADLKTADLTRNQSIRDVITDANPRANGAKVFLIDGTLIKVESSGVTVLEGGFQDLTGL